MTTSSKIRHRDVRGRFCKAPKASETPKPRKVVVVKVPTGPKPAEAIPQVGYADLVVNRNGQLQLPAKVWSLLTKSYPKDMVRTATWAIAQEELGLTLDKAMVLVTWPKFRPFMLKQLGVLKKYPSLLEVMSWSNANPNWGWKEGYAQFPRQGLGKVGPLGKLVQELDAIRKEGKTSCKNIEFLAQACQLIGWIS